MHFSRHEKKNEERETSVVKEVSRGGKEKEQRARKRAKT
jgi:hypothetical protein